MAHDNEVYGEPINLVPKLSVPLEKPRLHALFDSRILRFIRGLGGTQLGVFCMLLHFFHLDPTEFQPVRGGTRSIRVREGSITMYLASFRNAMKKCSSSAENRAGRRVAVSATLLPRHLAPVAQIGAFHILSEPSGKR